MPRHSRRPVQLLPGFISAAAASAEAASAAAARSAVSASALAAACCLAVLFRFAAAWADLASTAACYTTAASAALPPAQRTIPPRPRRGRRPSSPLGRVPPAATAAQPLARTALLFLSLPPGRIFLNQTRLHLICE